MGSGRTKNEKDCGVTSLEPVGRDKNSGLSVNRGSEDKRDPRKHIDAVIKREVTSTLELRAETTFLLVPLPDHNSYLTAPSKDIPYLFFFSRQLTGMFMCFT